MPVDHKIGIAANQSAFAVIAGVGVLVDPEALRCAHRHLLCHRSHLCIAAFSVGMLRDVTFGLHRDGREDQGVCGAEYHHGGKTRHDLVPAVFPLMRLFVLFRGFHRVLSHTPITSFAAFLLLFLLFQ